MITRSIRCSPQTSGAFAGGSAICAETRLLLTTNNVPLFFVAVCPQPSLRTRKRGREENAPLYSQQRHAREGTVGEQKAPLAVLEIPCMNPDHKNSYPHDRKGGGLVFFRSKFGGIG